MADYDVERALETIRNHLSSTFGKNLWDPMTPEEMRNIEIKCEEAYDSFLKSLGYDKPPYRVICDESNNSPEDIENGVLTSSPP